MTGIEKMTRICLVLIPLLLAFILGMQVGVWNFKRQSVIKTYEDGSFVGCVDRAICQE